MTFIEHIEDIPGTPAYAIGMYKLIDRQAEKVGAELAKRHPAVDELLSRPGALWLKESCKELASALERDPTGKLASIKSLRAWAEQPDGVGMTWVNWYATLYIGWLDQQQQQYSEAAE